MMVKKQENLRYNRSNACGGKHCSSLQRASSVEPLPTQTMKDVVTCDKSRASLETRFDPGNFRMGQPLERPADIQGWLRANPAKTKKHL